MGNGARRLSNILVNSIQYFTMSDFQKQRNQKASRLAGHS